MKYGPKSPKGQRKRINLYRRQMPDMIELMRGKERTAKPRIKKGLREENARDVIKEGYRHSTCGVSSFFDMVGTVQHIRWRLIKVEGKLTANPNYKGPYYAAKYSREFWEIMRPLMDENKGSIEDRVNWMRTSKEGIKLVKMLEKMEKFVPDYPPGIKKKFENKLRK